MISTNYTSIKSVLYDLINTIDERYWNETIVLEMAVKAVKKINFIQKLHEKSCRILVTDHKAKLPLDFVYLTQVAYTTDTSIDDNTIWSAMKLSSNAYTDQICLDKSLSNCDTCTHEFGISPDLVITTTLKDGTIAIAYSAYSFGEDNDFQIPNNEALKEAILHYILYRYWMSKYQHKEEGAEQRMTFHLEMWNTFSAKAAGELNMPDVSTLENIKNERNRLVPRTNRFNQLFTTLGNRGYANYV